MTVKEYQVRWQRGDGASGATVAVDETTARQIADVYRGSSVFTIVVPQEREVAAWEPLREVEL